MRDQNSSFKHLGLAQEFRACFGGFFLSSSRDIDWHKPDAEEILRTKHVHDMRHMHQTRQTTCLQSKCVRQHVSDNI